MGWKTIEIPKSSNSHQPGHGIQIKLDKVRFLQDLINILADTNPNINDIIVNLANISFANYHIHTFWQSTDLGVR
jgi:hypothetical protein